MRYLGKPRWSREDAPLVRQWLVRVVCFYMAAMVICASALVVKDTHSAQTRALAGQAVAIQ